MRVFISWAKEPSRTIALALRDWLPDVIQSLEPWVSSSDVGAGARWSTEIAQALSEARIGIICVTPENQKEPWLLFEAGALAKTLTDTFVCPYLIRMHPSDLAQGPLTQFQAKTADREGTLELLSTVNRALGADALPIDRLQRLFERSWPDLEKKLTAPPTLPVATTVQRDVPEMLSEVLETVRSLARRIPEPQPESISKQRERILHLQRIGREDEIIKHLETFGFNKESLLTILERLRLLTNTQIRDIFLLMNGSNRVDISVEFLKTLWAAIGLDPTAIRVATPSVSSQSTQSDSDPSTKSSS